MKDKTVLDKNQVNIIMKSLLQQYFFSFDDIEFVRTFSSSGVEGALLQTHGHLSYFVILRSAMYMLFTIYIHD